jgi:nucleoside 2-deoxyribosyltransferase
MQVYIAHPSFTEGQTEFKERFIARLKEHIGKLKHCGPITLIDPFDHAPNVEGNREDKIASSRQIKETCLNLLDGCKLLIAVVDDNDTGTAFEAGYAHHKDIPIILVSKDTGDSANAMLLGSAHARFDNVLDELQLSLLAGLIEWHYLQLRGPRLVPGKD